MNYITPYPLDEFYARKNIPMPAIRRVHPADIPQPCRQLLVHDRDMTLVQADYYRQQIGLEVKLLEITGDTLLRLVSLLKENRQPIVFGAIHIHLAAFEAAPRAAIEACCIPFGKILNDFRIVHHSRPENFFRVSPDELIRETLSLTGKPDLYGRSNTLYNTHNQTLAQVVEILPPLDEKEIRHE